MTDAAQAHTAEADQLYQQYGKPLEQEHWGQYVAISRTGEIVLAPTLVEAMQRARDAFGPGSFVFKVGEQAVGKWR